MAASMAEFRRIPKIRALYRVTSTPARRRVISNGRQSQAPKARPPSTTHGNLYRDCDLVDRCAVSLEEVLSKIDDMNASMDRLVGYMKISRNRTIRMITREAAVLVQLQAGGVAPGTELSEKKIRRRSVIGRLSLREAHEGRKTLPNRIQELLARPTLAHILLEAEVRVVFPYVSWHLLMVAAARTRKALNRSGVR